MNEKKQMPFLLRMLLMLVSILLCICLTVALLTTALVSDLRLLNNRDTFRQAVNTLFELRLPAARMSQTPDDTDSLIAQIIYEVLQSQDDENMKASKEDIAQFVADTNISEFLSDKAVDYVEDMVNGTQNAQVTTDELMELVLDNKELLEETFGMTLDDLVENNMREYFDKNNVGQIIHDQYISQIRGTAVAGDTTVGQIFDLINHLCEDRVFILLWVIVAVLVVALFFTCRMRPGRTLIFSGTCAMLVGVLLCLPLLAMDKLIMPQLDTLSPVLGKLINNLTGAISPMHFGMLIAGGTLLIAGIVVSCIMRSIHLSRQKQSLS